MNLDPDRAMGKIAAEIPAAVRVFERFGLDFCCGGDRPLAKACREKGLDPTTVLEEIRRAADVPLVTDERWDQAPPVHLVDHIEAAYHRPLREELPHLEGMARKVLEAHRETDGERLEELLRVFVALKAELEDHMGKEEEILFPMIRRGDGFQAEGPIRIMEEEHQNAGRALERLRKLTDDYEVPDHACNTWRALWRGLANLEEALHRHIHLENNVLFPRVLDEEP